MCVCVPILFFMQAYEKRRVVGVPINDKVQAFPSRRFLFHQI